MSKAKYIASAGIIAAGAALSGLPQENKAHAESTDSTKKEIIISAPASDEHTASLNADTSSRRTITCRTAQKVYHRFEEIPEISDSEAIAYNRDDYTYIINADQYQKTGKIELKRVLKDEVTKANTLSLIYRSECQTYNPRPNEDQLSKYVIDLRIMSKTGITKGPSQMDDNAIKAFIKYMAANPKTRQYVLPLLKTTNGSLEKTTKELEHKFFDENGDLRPMDERDAILHGNVYKSLYVNDHAWEKIASPKLKKFIQKTEAEKSKKVGRPVHLSNTTKNYLCLTELFPSEEFLIQQIEDYNLAFYQLGRPGKTKHVTAALARSMNLKDENGNLDATRLPPFAIAAAISSINWKGNGTMALKEAQNIRAQITNAKNKNDVLRSTVKNWVTGKSRRYGVDEMYTLNILTPDIIRQYKELELSGAKNLDYNYQKAIEIAESKVRIARNKSYTLAQDTITPQTQKVEERDILQKGKTLFLSAIDFVRGRS